MHIVLILFRAILDKDVRAWSFKSISRQKQYAITAMMWYLLVRLQESLQVLFTLKSPKSGAEPNTLQHMKLWPVNNVKTWLFHQKWAPTNN